MSKASFYQLDTRWQIVEDPDCFIVKDAFGFALAHIFFNSTVSCAALGQMSRRAALAVAEKMVAAQDKKIAVRQATEKLQAGEREWHAINRKLH